MKKILLKKYGVGRYDDVSPFIIDGDLEIAFDGISAVNGDYYAVSSCNGQTTRQRINGNIILSKDFLSAGELNITVVYYLNGTLLKEWVVEPLFLKEISSGLSAEPFVSEFIKSLNDISLALEALNKKMFQTEKTITDREEQARREKIGFLKYVYRHYIRDLRDCSLDLSLDDFASVIGVDVSDLSKEEKQEIEEFKTKEDIL